MKVRYTGM